MSIENKTVLITGANRGIGRALADEALQRGARRVYMGVRTELAITDERASPLILDITNPEEIRRAAEMVESLDVLVNNAGVALYDDLSDVEIIERHMSVNLFGPLRMAQAFLPQLTRARGAVINILSLAGVAPLPFIPAYSISKAAAFNMTQSLRMLLAARGVSVHAAILGPVDTDMNRGLEIPKESPASVARLIFDGLDQEHEEIFPDPASLPLARNWYEGPAKLLERQFAAFAQQSAAEAA